MCKSTEQPFVLRRVKELFDRLTEEQRLMLLRGLEQEIEKLKQEEKEDA